MSSIVLKFGGAALKNLSGLDQITEIICSKAKQPLVVVVSAMGEMTDSLLRLAYAVNPQPPKRELDMLLTAGERISMSLLAMSLAKRGIEALSFTGSQSGIVTTTSHSDAEILEIKPIRIRETLDQGKIAIVAGFQGVSTAKEITTLGRGGSDTSAVAIAVALNATHVEFYKDVEGIYSADPKVHPDAMLFATLSYEKALEVSGKILHARSILLASKNDLPLHVLPFNGHGNGTKISGAFSESTFTRSPREV